MKIKLLIAVLAGFTFTACTNTTPSVPAQKTVVNSFENASEAKTAAFKAKQREVGLSTKKDPNYHSPMSEIKAKNKKDWFNNQMYRLWDRQITRNQYITESVSEFPNHKYEFTFIANGF
ncbi:MAG: hypothetical protein J7J02_09025 [Sulfurovum sp.]|nr:hypothetical protein [Sulfurovum sp.]